MTKKRKIITTVLIILVFLLTVFGFFYQKNYPKQINYTNKSEDKGVSMANPASQNCLDKGGQLEIKENKIGEYGVCIFEDNRQCEEWALFRGECPVGGVKVTGYNSDQEIYCAISGHTVENNRCIISDDLSCSLYDFYNHNCP